MKFFGVHLEDLESDRFVEATNDQVATWLFLHALCCKMLNGGTITGARSLGDRFWGRHGLVRAIIDAPSPLWSWDGEDLTVEPYDIDGQKVYERKVAGGKTRAIQRWGNSENRTPHRTPTSSPDSSCNAPNPTQPENDLSDGEQIPKKSKTRGTIEELKAYVVEIGLPESDGEWLFDKWEGTGWKNDGKPIGNWMATARNWKRMGIMLSQKSGIPTAPAGSAVINGRIFTTKP